MQEFLNRNRSISQRVSDEGVQHLHSCQAQLRHFPVEQFEPDAAHFDPGLWEEYIQWRQTLEQASRLDYQSRWRFEDWQRRWKARLRAVRWNRTRIGDGPTSGIHPGSMANPARIVACFKTLGLEATATNEEIKQAYRRLAEEHHPDREGGDLVQMQEINAAYRELRTLRAF